MAGHRPRDWHVLDLDKDPTPGDPDRVRSLANQLHDFADDVGEALRLVKGMAEDDAVLQWAGKSAKVFQDEFSGVPKNLRKLKKSYEMCGDALAAFWPKLERAQALADKALAKARDAQSDLSSAKSRLSSADSWVTRASKEADKYKDDPTGSKSDGDKPDESKVRAATRDVQNAKSAHAKAQSDVTSAQNALDAAKKMAEDARKMREEAAREAKQKIDDASDAGIQNRSWWEDVGDWFEDNWDTIVAVCKVVVAVVGIIAMIIGGPILGAILLVAALVVLADTINKYRKGQASLWDVAFAALDCIPGGKGLTSLGKLAKGMKGLGKVGLKGMAKAARGGMAKLRREAQLMAERRCKSDPVDVVTGDVVASATDAELLGSLPLRFERHHVSSFRGGLWFGPSWGSLLDERLLLDPDGVRLVTADGMVLHYPIPEPGLEVLPVMGPRWPLEWSGGREGMRVTRPETGEVLRFEPLPAIPQSQLSLMAVTDRNGNSITVERDRDGTPRAIAREGSYRIGVEVTDRRVSALYVADDPEQMLIARYGYDDKGNLAEVYNSSGRALRMWYDDQHRIIAWRDRNGTEYRYEYDDQGRCIRTTGSEGFHNGRFEYSPDGYVTVHFDSLGYATTYQYDREFRITHEIDALGNTSFTEWGEGERKRAERDPLGHVTRYTYDNDGNLRTVVRPDGLETTAEYNGLGLPVCVTEPGNLEWRFDYDAKGNLLVLTDPLGAVTRHAYDEHGRLITVTDALGQIRRYDYDSLGRVKAVYGALGGISHFSYDAFGRVTAVTDANGDVTHYGWTPEGFMAWRKMPSGATETWAYDAEGNETEHRDRVGGVTRSSYTHFGLLRAQTRPDGTRLLFEYDTELRLTSLTDAAGRTWRYEYDAVGRPIRETDFAGRVMRYSYDAAGRLTSRTNALGQTTYYVRDVLGNVVEQRSSDVMARFEYDAFGRVLRAENGDGAVLLERDAVGRIVAETCNGRRIVSAYDPLGRRIRRQTPSGTSSSWEYDAENRPTVLHTTGHSLFVGYDADGRETLRRVGAAVITQAWDADDRLVGQQLMGVSGRPALHRTYTYRADEYPTEIVDSLMGRTRLQLDVAARVTAVQTETRAERYAYSPAGDLTFASWKEPIADSVGLPEAMGEREYGPLGVSRAGRITYEHDGQGRLVRRTQRLLSGGSRTWTYRWNDQDQLREVTTPDGSHWRYLYDALGRRIAKELIHADGAVAARTDFIWDGVELAEQLDSEEGRILSWEWSPHTGQPLTQTERFLGADAPQDIIDARFYAIVTDLVGAPTELVAPDGEIAWRLRTSLWGVSLATESGPARCPLRFPGQYHDDETGLHYNYFRYYDPALGRYCSLDPLGLEGGPNPGWYTPNPTVWIDPFGLALCRTSPRLETGDLKKGWIHIEGRHITGTNPSTKHADMMPLGTTREQVHAAAKKVVQRGQRISDPAKRIQTFEKRMKVNGFTARYRVSVDSHDGNNIITFFPVGRSAQ